LRIAVPDGFHPDPDYIEYVRPGGTGAGADDHKVLYNYKLLSEQLRRAGFEVTLLEYWDENGDFHFRPWSSRDGYISRSRDHDERNQNGTLAYTSLIVDAIKPKTQ
jgi:predicted SAM-dependent methyltransferase